MAKLPLHLARRRIESRWTPKFVVGNFSKNPYSQDFRKRGKEMVDYIADYMDNVHQRRVTPAIEPGYLRFVGIFQTFPDHQANFENSPSSEALPADAPEQPQSFDDVMTDVDRLIMPGVVHWQHPRFHAYFPAGNSYPSILADMLSDGLGAIGFSWAACPAITE